MATIQYILNDPTTPALVVPIDIPAKPGCMDFAVEGFNGLTSNIYTPEWQAASCHVGIVRAINLVNSVLKNPVSKWAATNTLYVQPRAGKQLNAFYDRRGLKFFFAKDPITNNMVFSSNSFDVVLHETGHAILDALRPDLFNVQAYEVWGFHESFGDIHSMVNFLQHDFAIDAVLAETGNNMNQSSVLTRLAEEMGAAIYHVTGGSNGNNVGFLRNAFNGFTYSEPEMLGRQGRDDQLTSEPHSFSRVFTGAWYDMLVAIYNAEKDSGVDPKNALINARNVLTTYTFNAIPNVPATIRFYDAFAKAMLVQDKLNNYKYNSIMNDVFIKRGILRQVVKPLSCLPWSAFKTMLDPNDEVFENSQTSTVRSKNIETVSLPNYMLNVAAPNDIYYEFDSNGNCVETITSGLMEITKHAQECVSYLYEKGLIRQDKLTPFEIDQDGNLKRSHFSGCFLSNCTNYGQPEYLKCWKRQNNAGCGCNAKKKDPCVTSEPTVVTTANTRLKVNGCGFNSVSSANDTKYSFVNSTKTSVKC
jgi:hypothetical protein